MKSVRIVKRNNGDSLSQLQQVSDEIPEQKGTSDVARTVKGWVAELHRRQRDEHLTSFKKFRAAIALVMLSFLAPGTASDAQPLHHTWGEIQQAVAHHSKTEPWSK